MTIRKLSLFLDVNAYEKSCSIIYPLVLSFLYVPIYIYYLLKLLKLF